MTSEDVRSELEKVPFAPLRIHLVSGKTVKIDAAGVAFMLQNAILVLHSHNSQSSHDESEGYDVVALRNIERLERLAVPLPPRA